MTMPGTSGVGALSQLTVHAVPVQDSCRALVILEMYVPTSWGRGL